jgi:hypothetical protein
MIIDGAKITEQGVTFAIAVVKSHVLTSSDHDDVRNSFIQVFGNIPIILMAQDSRGIPKYYGRQDIVKFLANIDPSLLARLFSFFLLL